MNGRQCARPARCVHNGASGPVFPRKTSLLQLCAQIPTSPTRCWSPGDCQGPCVPEGAKTLSASYFWPMQSHGSIGPSCAVADVRADAATVWTASQGTHGNRKTFARFLGLPQDKVRLIYLDGAGCYGMNGHEDAAADAAILSRAVGRPVRVQWSREDEHGWDPKGPPQLLDISGAVGPDGRILEWRTEMWLPQTTRGLPDIPLLAPAAAGLDDVRGLQPGFIWQNADPPYAADNVQVLVHWLKDAPLRTAPIRSPGKPANCFAVESFTDELAAAAGLDPIEFRLRGLDRCARHRGDQAGSCADELAIPTLAEPQQGRRGHAWSRHRIRSLQA